MENMQTNIENSPEDDGEAADDVPSDEITGQYTMEDLRKEVDDLRWVLFGVVCSVVLVLGIALGYNCSGG